MKVVMSVAAAVAALGLAGCATTAPYGVATYSSATPGYYAGYATNSAIGERQLLNNLPTNGYVPPGGGTVAYSSATLGQSDYLSQRDLFPPPSDPMGCHRYIIDPDDPCFWYSP